MIYAESEWQALWRMDYREFRIRKGHLSFPEYLGAKWTAACKYAYANRHEKPPMYFGEVVELWRKHPDRLLVQALGRPYFFTENYLSRVKSMKKATEMFLRNRYGLE